MLATVGLYDYAAKDSTNTFITGLSQVTGGYTAIAPSTGITFTAATNADFSGAAGEYRYSSSSNTTPNDVRFNNAATKDNYAGNSNSGNVGFEMKSGTTVSMNGILVTLNIAPTTSKSPMKVPLRPSFESTAPRDLRFGRITLPDSSFWGLGLKSAALALRPV